MVQINIRLAIGRENGLNTNQNRDEADQKNDIFHEHIPPLPAIQSGGACTSERKKQFGKSPDNGSSATMTIWHPANSFLVTLLSYFHITRA